MTEVLTSKDFKRELLRVYDWSPQHVIGQTRAHSEAALASGQLQEGWTVTFYDERGDDTYCLAVIEQGKIVVRFKTHGTMTQELDS